MEPGHSVPCAHLCAGHIDGEMNEVACDSCAECTIFPVLKLRAFQSGLLPPANNLCPIDDHGELSCIAQHVRRFVSQC